MALELSELKFSANTLELEKANQVIGTLVQNVGKLDKAARDQARTEATLAKAAKDSAKANLDNAKAQDVKVKSTLAVEQANQKVAAILERNNLLAQKEARAIAEAEERKVKAVEAAEAKKAKAREDAAARTAKAEQAAMAAMAKRAQAEQAAIAKAAEKSNSILKRQNDIYDFMTQGFSKGQSSILATAKSTGQLSDELKRVLDDMKAFSSDSFDKSELGLKRLQKTMKETVAAQGYFNEGSNLTTKQARELSNDLDRIGVSLKRQGKSYQEVTQAQALHKQQFIEEAAAVNRAQSALDVVTKQRKEVVTATNYLTQAEQKMSAALNTSNAALDKAGTDSLVKYETALRKSGLSQDIATQKLAKYKVQLAQVQAEEMKRREQHLTRAVAPQATDIVVSLWSGQSPLTVLLQQGGQLTDMFMLSGVAADKFGEVVKKSMKSMLPSILTVAKGVGGLIVDGFVAAGSKVQNFLADIFHLNGAMNKLYEVMSADGPSKWGGWIRNASAILTGTFAVGIAVVTAGLVALAVGLKQVITENDELAKTLALSGGQLGLSHAAAIQYAKSMELAGVSTGEAIKVISEMAKVGNLGKDSINMITRAAIDMEAYAGVSIEDTVKAFSKFKDKPVEALIELAKQTGLVSEEVLKSVRTLQEQGDQLGAASLSMEAYADVTRQQAARIKEDYNGLSLFFKELGKSIGDYWDGIFKNLFRLPSQTEALEASFGIVNDKLTKAKATVALAGPDFATSRQKQEVKDLEEQVRLISSQIGSSVRVSGEGQRVISNNIADAKANEQAAALRAKYATTEQQSLAEITKLRKQEELWKKAGLLTDERRLIIESGIVAEQKKIDKSREHKSSPSENYYATLMREATNNTIAADNATKELTKSEQKLLEIKSDSRFAKLSALEKANIEAKYAGSIASERAAEATKKEVEADELKSKLLGKASGLGKEYYSTLEQIQKYNKEGVYSDSEVQQLTEALYKATPAYRENIKQVEELNAKLLEYKQAAMDSDAAIFADNRSIEHRLSLIGLTTEEQRLATVEYERQNKLSKVALELEKQKLKIQKDFADNPVKRWELEMQAERIASEQTSAINREAAIPQDKGDNWLTGAKNALDKYRDEAQNVAKSTEDMFSKAFKGMEDALVSFVKTGKLDFASLADSIITDLIRIQIQQSVMPGLSAGLNAGASWVASLFSANGNAFDTSGQVQKFAKGGTFTNQIVDQPTPFKFAKGTGIMGEAGPEAIMPLTRGSDGKLGVQASGGNSGNSIIVNVIESPGNGGQQSRRTENGVDILDVFVEKVKSSIATDINRGSGAVPNAMASTYGLNRVAGAY